MLLRGAAVELRDAGTRNDSQRVNDLAGDIRRFKEEANAAVELDDLELLTELWNAVVRRAAIDASPEPNEPFSLIDHLQELLEHFWRVRSIFQVDAAQAPLEAIEALLAQVRDAADEYGAWSLVRSFNELEVGRWVFYVAEGKFGQVERINDGPVTLPVTNFRGTDMGDALSKPGVIPVEFRFKPDDVLVHP